MIDVEAHLPRGQRQRARNRQRERRAAQLRRIDPQKQIMHDRVADEHGLHHLVGLHARFAAHARYQRVHRLAHRPRQRHLAAGVHHHVTDAAHQILAEADLRVRGARRGDRPPTHQIGEVHGDRRGPNIAGDTEQTLRVPRPHRVDHRMADALVVDGAGHLPFARAQNFLDARHQRKVERQPLQMMVALECPHQPVGIAQRLMHVRLLDLDVIEPRRQIARDVAGLGALPHHLRVDGDVGRNVDDEIALDFRRAGEAAVGRQRAHALVALLGVGERRQVLRARRDGVLGEIALRHHHLAAPADAPPAADALDVDAERAGRIEHRRAERETPAPPGRHEEDEGVFAGGRLYGGGAVCEDGWVCGGLGGCGLGHGASISCAAPVWEPSRAPGGSAATGRGLVATVVAQKVFFGAADLGCDIEAPEIRDLLDPVEVPDDPSKS